MLVHAARLDNPAPRLIKGHMPIYEYRCAKCGNEFDALQKVGAAPPPCDACGGAEVSKLVSRASFVLKGGGWYKDGYGSTAGTAKAEKSDSGPSTSASTSTSTTPSTTSTPSTTPSTSSTDK